MNSRPIRVLIVDDSALVRKLLSDSLSRFPDIEVVGTAIDPYIARDKILSLNPDVVTLDIEMPRMDGITFLRLIMKHRPMPVIIISSLTQEGSNKALEALQAGAVEVLAKPSGSYSVFEDSHKLAEVIRGASEAKVRYIDPEMVETPKPVIKTPKPVLVASPAPPSVAAQTTLSSAAQQPVRAQSRPAIAPSTPAATIARPAAQSAGRSYSPHHLILMGASTGGTEALRTVLTALPEDMPGICIVQHIPPYFSLAFANRLNEICRIDVREAKNGDIVQPGLALIAPGGHHMILRWQGNRYVVELNDGPAVHHQRPAVDILFDSAAKIGAAPHSQAVLLTGMGADGANGMLKLRQAGAATIAQNEETCVVFGMPKEAIKLGAAQQILPLQQVAAKMDRFASECASGSH